MLLNLLPNVEEKLKEHSFFVKYPEKLSVLVEFLKFYKKDDIIFPNVIKVKIDANTEEVYDILTVLVGCSLLEINYKVWCDGIEPNSSPVYRSLLQVPKDTCDLCGQNCDIINYLVVVFRVA